LESKIQKLLKDLKISNGDHLILHGNLAIFNQVIDRKNIKSNLKLFLRLLKKKIGKKGIVLIPTFTYSFCTKNKFDIDKSKSEVGMFSELSRQLIKKRTFHPIFSFVFMGDKKNYLNSSIDTCFGKDSFFDHFKKNNGKILCLGCSFNSITFLHHIEEMFKVNYRRYKFFSGYVKKKNSLSKINTNYFIRKNRKIKNNFTNFEKYLKKKKKISYHNFGRFNVIKINSIKMFQQGIKILKKNPYHFL